MIENNTLSRRHVLQFTGTITIGLLAGCADYLPFASSETTVIEDVTFEGEQAVVHLKDGTKADEIDFRSPNDELLNTVSIERKSKVTVPLKETHSAFPPGTYSLEAVDTEENEPQTIDTHEIKLTSSFEVEEVRPVKHQMQSDFTPDPPETMGKVRISIRNTGTLPVRIMDLGIPEGVPDPTDPPTEQTSSIQASSPFQIVSTQDRLPTIIPIDEQVTFESVASPLGYYQQAGQQVDQNAVGVPEEGASWEQIKENQCNGQEHPASVVVMPEQGTQRRLSVTFKYDGEAIRGQSFDTDYECMNVTATDIEAATNTSEQ